jgi:hypothetical protein
MKNVPNKAKIGSISVNNGLDARPNVCLGTKNASNKAKS